ncbi:alpha/beta hydrolase [Nocardia zapadnayensis]|nr:alpha/beta hydrolase [Nocardia zapadnayensis]MCX0277304.1 alpha/beta hydrolase [Nocardia zapadnayensis]
MSRFTLSDEARAYLAENARRNPVPAPQLTLAEARAAAVDLAWRQSAPVPVAAVRDTFAVGPAGYVPLRIHDPGPAPAAGPPGAAGTSGTDAADPAPAPAESPLRPALLMLPGGGWVTGTAEIADVAARRLAVDTGAVVVTVTYAKAPEHPFPLPLLDCVAAFAWVVAHAAELGVDPARIGIIGDSAGGNLAAATALALRDTAEIAVPQHRAAAGADPAVPPVHRCTSTHRPAALVLLYPATDAACDTASYRDFATDHGLTADRMAYYWDCYTDAGSRFHPLASVGRAELHELPPTVVVTAGCDVLRSEGEAFAAGLAAAGTPCELWEYPHTVHGFFHSDGVLHDAAELLGRLGRTLPALLGDRASL